MLSFWSALNIMYMFIGDEVIQRVEVEGYLYVVICVYGFDYFIKFVSALIF